MPALLGIAACLAVTGVLGVALGALARHPAGAVGAVTAAVLLPSLLAPLLGDLGRDRALRLDQRRVGASNFRGFHEDQRIRPQLLIAFAKEIAGQQHPQVLLGRQELARPLIRVWRDPDFGEQLRDLLRLRTGWFQAGLPSRATRQHHDGEQQNCRHTPDA